VRITTHRHDFLSKYVADLDHVIDMAAIRNAQIRIGVDPLGGAGVHYWARIAEHHRLDLTVVSDEVDPTFGIMTVDWDGKIRMDPSSPFAMQRLFNIKDRYDIAFACDTDHDRHGIVTEQLLAGIAERRTAALAVCGGASPVELFKDLRTIDLPW
jgi:phosphoglucomutase